METLLDNIDPATQRLIVQAFAFVLFAGLIAAGCLINYNRHHPVAPSILTQRITERAWSSPALAASLGFILLFQLIVGAVARALQLHNNSTTQMFISLTVTLITLGVIGFIGRRMTQPTVFKTDPRPAKMLLLAPIFYLALIPLSILINLLWIGLCNLLGIKPELQPIIQEILQAPAAIKALFILIAVIVAPFYEEFIFRGLLFPFLLRRIGIVHATAVVAIIFAALHFHLFSFGPIAFLGAILCLLYWRTGSLWAPIGLHAIFNAFSILHLLLLGAGAN